MRAVSTLACMMVLQAAPMVSGSDFYPFTEGFVNEFERIPMNLGTYICYFSGMEVVNGEPTHVQRVYGYPTDDRMFWSETEEGDKLFHGSQFRVEPPYLFSPPIVMIDEPLHVGKTWTVETRASDGLAIRVDFEVISFGIVGVPAGSFMAFTIRDTWSFPEDGKGVVLCEGGKQAVRGSNVSRRSYAEGVGMILDQFGSRTDQLVARRTVSVEEATWTQVRSLFR